MADRKLTIGAVEIVALTDAEAPFPLAQVFPGVEAGRWAPYRERYPAFFADAGAWRSRFGSYLVRAPGRTILVDTGIGPGPVAGLGGACGASARSSTRRTGLWRCPRPRTGRPPPSPRLRGAPHEHRPGIYTV